VSVPVIIAIAVIWTALVATLLALGRAAAVGDDAVERAARRDVRARSDVASAAARRAAGAARDEPTRHRRPPGRSSPPARRPR